MSRVNSVELSIDFLFGVGVAYLILILIATAILFFPSARFVVSAAAIGAATVWEETRFRYQDLQDAIYGEPSAFAGHQVHAGTNSLFLLGVLGLLFWIAATKALD
jgi:hypothetical protein